jgi:GAF domain-containing protein
MPATKRPPKKRSPSLKEANAKLVRENKQLRRERDEALEREAATSEILRMIARSGNDLRSMFETIAENAARLCDAKDALIFRVEGDVHRRVAAYGPIPTPALGISGPNTRGTPVGRTIVERRTIHVKDMTAELETEFPEYKALQQATGTRTMVSAPLLRDGTALGVIHVRRTEVRPFTEHQIKLLETFADQAVIAIENLRLFKELQERNRDLSELLEQQTATSEVLRVIASSPTELQPVLDTLIANAVKLSGATQGHIRQYDGELLRPVTHYGESPEQVALLQRTARKPVPENTTGRAFLERKPIHILDAQLEPRHPGLALRSWARTMLAVPLLREGTPIGVITIWRDFVEAFTERQIDLVKTFADQAVIAIENVRLFQELKESLEQQTATSEILGVIASSPTDIQPVLDAVAQNAARLCDASDALIRRVDGDVLAPAAHYGQIPIPGWSETDPTTLSRGSVSGRAVIDRQTIHIHDLAAEPVDEFPVGVALAQRFGYRTVLVTPLMRQDVALGAIIIRRPEVRPFTDKQINLLKTFADQAVIAIENVRLFK